MNFSKDRCLSCRTPSRSRYHPIDDFWFCSQECYSNEVEKLIPNEYKLGKTAFDSSEMKNLGEELADEDDEKNYRRINEIVVRWKTERQQHIDSAKTTLNQRIEAEARHLRQEQEEKDRITQEKEEAKEEQERLAEEAQTEKLKPRDIPSEIRLEHTHVLGPSGSGKTTLLQNNILQDFVDSYGRDEITLKDEPPAYIIIDPKGLMVERLSRLQIFAPGWIYHNRLVIVDPFDAPALSLFKTHGRNPSQLISDLAYVFSTTNQKLTGKQLPCFSFCAQLLFTLPDANLFTLLDLLDDRKNKKSPNQLFLNAISKLPPTARRFFDGDYYGANYASTREEIKSRIYGVLENDALSTMLNANTRKLDLARCIRERKIVLVNTRMTQLKEAHQTLGRYILVLAQDAIQSRTERHPVYIVIDEFQEFADPKKTPGMLRLIREYGGGAVLAHQNMYCPELDEDTRNAISTNTSIKYASSPEAQDLGYMARDLRCDPNWLKQQHKSKEFAKFACFVRGMHPPLDHPFIVTSRLGWIDKWQKMSDADYKAMRARNKAALQDEKKTIVYSDGRDYLPQYGGTKPEPTYPEMQKTIAEKRAQEGLPPLKQVRGLMTKADLDRMIEEQKSHGSDTDDEPIQPQEEYDPSKPSPWKRK